MDGSYRTAVLIFIKFISLIISLALQDKEIHFSTYSHTSEERLGMFDPPAWNLRAVTGFSFLISSLFSSSFFLPNPLALSALSFFSLYFQKTLNHFP